MGYEIVWNTFLDQVVEEGLPKDDKLVNIFGIVPYHDPFWSGTLEEIDRILSKLGLKVNIFFTKGQGIEAVRTSSAAALNIIVNPWLFNGPAKKYETKFGVPSIRVPGLFMGATDTTKFVRQVAVALQLDKEKVDAVIEEEEDYVYGYLAQAIQAEKDELPLWLEKTDRSFLSKKSTLPLPKNSGGYFHRQWVSFIFKSDIARDQLFRIP